MKAEKQKDEARERLKTAYRADKGHELVRKGKSKTSSVKTVWNQSRIMITGLTLGASLANQFNRRRAVIFVKGKGAIPVSSIAANAALGSAFVAATVLGVVNEENNRNIDAYRSESRKRS